MDHDKLHPGEIVCHACLFCFDDRNQNLTTITGKNKPQRMRNYSHFIVNDKWYPLSKGEKGKMRELIWMDPSVAVIAISGQKHITFRARPGWWQIEENCIAPNLEALEKLMGPVESLYQAGATKTEIESGHYYQKSIAKVGLALWRDLELKLRIFRGGPYLALAVFLAQKDDDDTGANS